VTEHSPVAINEREWDRGLWRMVIVSGGLHLASIALLLVVPYSFAHRPPPMISYTVDLVAPDKVGGTNLVAGGKGRVEGPPLVAARPAPKAEPPKPVPKPEEAKPPEPQKAEPQKEASKPEPKPQPPPAEAKPKEPEAKPKEETKPQDNEAVLAQKAKKAEPPPSPKAAPSPKVVAKAEPPKAPPAAQSKAEAEAAKKAAAEAAAARERDERITAAVKRVEQQLGVRGGGTGQKAGDKPGGPVAVGPGEGAGGQIIGVEYLLYYNEMINRIKQSWAWAGADRSLEAVVRFSIAESGEVLDVRITHPSGDVGYDASVERAVKAVNPLPPPPEAFRKQFSDVEITFSPESLQM
jgi:TonB family protein